MLPRLDDTMRNAYNATREVRLSRPNVLDLRTAAFVVAIEKIARAEIRPDSPGGARWGRDCLGEDRSLAATHRRRAVRGNSFPLVQMPLVLNWFEELKARVPTP